MIIELNIDDIIEEFEILNQYKDILTETIINNVTNEIYRNWQIEASNVLKSTRSEYVNNLQILKINKGHNAIILKGWLPNAIEKGIEPFDMKKGFEKSNKRTIIKRLNKRGQIIRNGWYLNIPFRHATPGALGENAVFSTKMPMDIYKLVKPRLMNDALKKRELPKKYQVLQKRPTIEYNGQVFPSYTHKSPIYEGLVKKSAPYDKVIQNYYMTFRRVSDKSDPNSWIHKGIQAHNFMEKAVKNSNVSIVAENTVDEFLKNLGV